ncbi:helix-turn-helix transcriptional regulator [Candidatus Bipolaricaulota bacterium]|nr:helix-turn-helix transcriptional regulator [Candidatus Bipolaricaulota bacterium]
MGTPSIGKGIRALRLRKRLTLKELSSECGLSVSFLSQIERGISSPSIVSLASISKALGVPVSMFLTDHHVSSSPITRADEQLLIRIAESAVSYRYLSGAFPERVIEVLINEFPTNHHHPPASHDGEEFGYVLEGHLVLTIEGKAYALGPGDSYHFLATQPHGYRTSETEGARVLVATTQKFIETQAERQRQGRSDRRAQFQGKEH